MIIHRGEVADRDRKHVCKFLQALFDPIFTLVPRPAIVPHPASDDVALLCTSFASEAGTGARRRSDV